ncbi:MAG: ROK family transcriptional regulator [Calditrichae bacterium]|nr:ROK family transcriptional regulator [Calditrichota bacterium]MCB9058548.1 ROK family transcriptional regulator [Calditrichia bacterium]
MISIIEKLSRNELRIFRAVYEKGPVSRVRVARGLNLTRPAVTLYTKKLTDLGLIKEVGKGASSQKRGRREIMLAVNPDAGIILAVHITLSSINFGLIKLNGQIISKEKQEFSEDSKPEEILSLIHQSLKRMIKQHHYIDDQIFGISIALPGIIDYNAGTVKEKTRYGWEGFNLKKYFEDNFKLKAFIENDVKALTLGEFYFGIGRRVNDMVCFWLKDGIGAGIIFQGKLLRGFTSSAGEIGFNEFVLDINANKSILIDGSIKCWGNILSYMNIRKAIGRGISDGWETILSKDASIDDFIAALKKNDPLARYIFSLISNVLGSISCNIAYSYNPRLLVLAGPLFEKIPELSSETKHHMEKGTLKAALESLDLKTSILGEDGFLIGCAALHLEYIFKAAESSVMDEDI